MRFDYRGMGDSGGGKAEFDSVSEDLRSAIDCFAENTAIQKVILWGLCDGASASLIYGHCDERVASQILLNPWVRSEETLAKTYVRHYYLRRLASLSFWKKLLSGRLFFGDTLLEFGGHLRKSMAPNKHAKNQAHVVDAIEHQDFRANMLHGFKQFSGPICFLLSGSDLTALEFEEYTQRSVQWRAQMGRADVNVARLPGADHTFSRSEWRDEVVARSLEWISSVG